MSQSSKNKIKWEIVFVDDKSNDKTKNYKINTSENISLIESPIKKGLGNAISIGWQNVKLIMSFFRL